MKKEAIASGDQDKEDICFTRLRTSTLQLVCQKAKPVFRVKKHRLYRHFRLFDSRCETMFSICENCRSQAQSACNPSPYNNKWGYPRAFSVVGAEATSAFVAQIETLLERDPESLSPFGVKRKWSHLVHAVSLSAKQAGQAQGKG